MVEHSGRLQGGHYTAYVRVRSSESANDCANFFSSPAAKTEEMPSLLAEMERKVREEMNKEKTGDDEEEVEKSANLSGKWFHVSDSHSSEVSEEKVLKAQAYLLFYQRIQ